MHDKTPIDETIAVFELIVESRDIGECKAMP